MKESFNVLIMIALASMLVFVSCKKDTDFGNVSVELKNEKVTTEGTTMSYYAEYSYPANLKAATILVSQNSSMSDAQTATCDLGNMTLYASLTGLNANTTYYYKLKYDTGYGTLESGVKSFATEGTIPTVVTGSISEITQTSAVCGGEVTDDGGAEVTVRGVCWSSTDNPTLSDAHNASGSGTGSYSVEMPALTANTTYYVRAYATNSKGTSYGEQKSFTTLQSGTVTTPTVTSSYVTNITQTTATCGGNVTSDGGATVTARGVCWSTSPNPTINNSHTTNGSGTGTFTSSITGLTANTTYFARAYATNSKGTSYGSQKGFTTTSGSIGGHEYVDLGLPSGLLWATCNVGAENPEDYGDYFAWGETTTKSDYDWDTYQWCNGSSSTLTKYCTDSSCGYNGFVDNKTVLEMTDDAARANWGGDWRMPTTDEWKELYDNTTSGWATAGGVYGRRFTSKVSGHTSIRLFLPAAGYYRESSLYNDSSCGCYWSSSLSSYSRNAYDLYFGSDNVHSQNFRNRFYGFSVRPVR